MTRRRLVLAAVVLAMLSASFGPLTYLHFRTPLAVRLFEQMKLGMTRAEVVTLLGPPVVEWTVYRLEFAIQVQQKPPLREVGPPESDLRRNGSAEWWHLDEHLVLVIFDDTNAVCRAEIFAPLQEPTFLERIRQWLGL